MADGILIKQQKAYMCAECGLAYQDRTAAEKCRQWCEKHKSCNLAITKRAINK